MTSPTLEKSFNRAIRKRRQLDDLFFEEGNVISLDSLRYVDASSHLNPENGAEYNHDGDAGEFITIPCRIPYCEAILDRDSEEEHFELVHAELQCKICKSVWPSNHLLDLHIQETHDSYFQTALERAIHPLQYKQHPAKRIDILSLRCLEESCQETFETEGSRYAHLVSVHEYPEWFRFNHQTEKRHDSTKTRRRDGQKNKRQSKSNSSVEKKLQRKQRQKDKRASIPCRYFAQGHCRYSDKCMFLHESRDDMDIDDLVEQVKTKARVSVPDKISFGRRHRG